MAVPMDLAIQEPRMAEVPATAGVVVGAAAEID
jgi:hypothetical protein